MTAQQKQMVGELTWRSAHRPHSRSKARPTITQPEATFKIHCLTPQEVAYRRYRQETTTLFARVIPTVIFLALLFFVAIMAAYSIDPKYW